MSNSVVPVDQVVDLVKNLLDGTRCPICDTSIGNRIRYPCGHIACTDCVAEACTLCLTPPAASVPTNTVDEPFTERVNNANSLLNICQSTFNVDVYKYRRISEQLKIEKDLFPDCIQAPVKYSNKRKSFITNNNKENNSHLLFPGENISPKKQIKMKKHGSFLNHWLDENVTYSRKVFSELNVNQQSNIIRDKKVKDNIIRSRKRIQTYSPMRQNGDSLTKKKRVKGISENITIWKDKLQKKPLHEDSGIVIDDESICIDDSQSVIIDKDKLAFLAVEQADKKHSNSISFRSLDHRQEIKSKDVLQASKSTNFHHQIKVPFYKKSYLIETCVLCKEKETFHYEKKHKNLSVSLESNDFITTIKISDNIKSHQKKSVCIQTDIESYDINEEMDIKNSIIKNIETDLDETQIKESQDIFIEDSQLNDGCDIKKKDNIITDSESDKKLPGNKTVIIDDSDSDTTNEESTYLQVSADVHVSCEAHDYGILSEIDTDDLVCRSRNKVRGATPDSSNSSEKENCDPNKIKKSKGLKKTKSTKKMYI